MTLINIYLCVIGAVLLRLLISSNPTYFVSCALLGLFLGLLQGSTR